MNKSLLYLSKRTFVNRVKHAIRKPMTFVATVGILLYAVLFVYSFSVVIEDFQFYQNEQIAALLSILIFWAVPTDVASYCKRKGLVIPTADIHFMYPAPLNPKLLVLYREFRNFMVLGVMGLALSIFAFVGLHLSLGKSILTFLFIAVIQNSLEASLCVFCYANEKFTEKFFKGLTTICYLSMAVMVVVALGLMFKDGFRFSVMVDFLNHPVVQLVPIIGWCVAFIHLFICGPTVVNVVASVIYIVFTVVMCVICIRMKCTGEYYEDAASFSEYFANARKRAQKGEIVRQKKAAVKTASVEYKGSYAKAIFYRQLLEYKKNRFFIFAWNSLLFLGIGVVLLLMGSGVVSVETPFSPESKVYVIPLIMAYIIMIFSGYQTKWAKELEKSYTYLIPDSGFKKLWYSTLIEHIRACIDGMLLTIPGGIGLGLSPVYMILTIAVYVCLNANKLYINMLVDALIGVSLGNTGKTLLRSIIQFTVFVMAVVVAVLFAIFLDSPQMGFVAIVVFLASVTFGIAIGAATSFDKMEKIDA